MLFYWAYVILGPDFYELLSNSIFLKVNYWTTFSLIVIDLTTYFYLVLNIY